LPCPERTDHQKQHRYVYDTYWSKGSTLVRVASFHKNNLREREQYQYWLAEFQT